MEATKYRGSHLKLILEVTTFHRWMEDREYIEKEVRHIRKRLTGMEGADKELALLDRFEKSFLKMVGV